MAHIFGSLAEAVAPWKRAGKSTYEEYFRIFAVK
jgi:hypothetical protein